MRIPTVRVKCRKTGKEMTINESDWALGSIPGVDMGGWDRIGETHGDREFEALAVQAGKDQRETVENQRPKGKALDKKLGVGKNAKSPSIKTEAKTTKKAVTKKKAAKKKTTRKKTAK